MSLVKTFAKNPAGKLILNPRKLDVQAFWLVPDAPNGPTVVGGVASGVNVGASLTSGPITFTVGQDGPFEADYLSHYRLRTDTGAESFLPASVDIFDEGLKRNLVNRPVHIDTVFGKQINAPAGQGNVGIGPHLLAERLFLHSQRALVMRFANLSAASQQNFFPVVHGRRYYGYANPSQSLAQTVEKRAARARVSSPFWFTLDTDINGQIAATTVNYLLTVTADGHFEWWKTMYMSDQDFLMTIVDQRNGRAFSNGAIYCRAGMGTASFPYVMPEHTLLQANSRLQFIITNLAAAATLTAWITLGGRRIYVG